MKPNEMLALAERTFYVPEILNVYEVHITLENNFLTDDDGTTYHTINELSVVFEKNGLICNPSTSFEFYSKLDDTKATRLLNRMLARVTAKFKEEEVV